MYFCFFAHNIKAYMVFTLFVFIAFNRPMYCFVGQHWAISEIYILNTDFLKYKYKNEYTEIYIVYRKSEFNIWIWIFAHIAQP